MGANRPLRRRFEAMTWVMLRPMPGSGTPGSVMKSGSAIGSGRMLPWVTSSLSTAPALRGDSDARVPAAAPAPNTIRRRRVNIGDAGALSSFIFVPVCRRPTSAPDHVTRVERDLDVLPQFIGFGPEHVERLAAEHRADGAVARRHEQRALAGGGDHRRRRQRAVGL